MRRIRLIRLRVFLCFPDASLCVTMVRFLGVVLLSCLAIVSSLLLRRRVVRRSSIRIRICYSYSAYYV